jgi:hypothetical protein
VNDDLSVAILGVGLWLPGFASGAAWALRQRDELAIKPVGLAFDRTNRRRASGLGRAIADAAAEAMAAAGVDASTTPVVVGSSIGEASTMIGLLEGMWRTRTPMSPAAFTVSVHNAASGLLSISQNNLGFTTSVAADYDTPAATLLEGIGLIAAGHQHVVVACADEASPNSLIKDAPQWDLLAAAIILAPANSPRRLATLQLTSATPVTLPPADVDGGLVHNPQMGLVDLVDAVQRRCTGTLALDRGRGRGYLAVITPEGQA